jgi:hypothetical protein
VFMLDNFSGGVCPPPAPPPPPPPPIVHHTPYILDFPHIFLLFGCTPSPKIDPVHMYEARQQLGRPIKYLALVSRTCEAAHNITKIEVIVWHFLCKKELRNN